MTTQRRILFITLIAAWSLIVTVANVKSQSPAPIVVQAASPATATSTTTAAVTKDADSVQAAIKALQQMKAANDEILSKQKATLERLDELQQAAEELKIFSKRG